MEINSNIRRPFTMALQGSLQINQIVLKIVALHWNSLLWCPDRLACRFAYNMP
jgi:hypothetical protein